MSRFVFSSLLGFAALVLTLAAPAEGPKKLLLMAGTPSHGPGEHEFNAGVLLLAQCLESVENLEVVVQLNGWPEDQSKFEGVDGICCTWTAARSIHGAAGAAWSSGQPHGSGRGLMCALQRGGPRRTAARSSSAGSAA